MYIHLGEEVRDGIFKIDNIFNTEKEITEYEAGLETDEEQEYIEIDDCGIGENDCYDVNNNEIVALNEEVVEEEFECRIGDVNYKTLNEAIQAAENDATIVLLKDIDGTYDSQAGKPNFNVGKDLNIDLNSKTLTRGKSHSSLAGYIGGGIKKFFNGTIINQQSSSNNDPAPAFRFNVSNSKLILEDCVLDYIPSSTNGTNYDFYITSNGNEYSNLVIEINNCTVKSRLFLNIANGDIYVNNSTIENTFYDCKYNNSKSDAVSSLNSINNLFVDNTTFLPGYGLYINGLTAKFSNSTILGRNIEIANVVKNINTLKASTVTIDKNSLVKNSTFTFRKQNYSGYNNGYNFIFNTGIITSETANKIFTFSYDGTGEKEFPDFKFEDGIIAQPDLTNIRQLFNVTDTEYEKLNIEVSDKVELIQASIPDKAVCRCENRFYDTITDAFDDIQNQDKDVKLIKDVTLTSNVEIGKQYINNILDMNGYSIDGGGDKVEYVITPARNSVDIIIKNSKSKTKKSYIKNFNKGNCIVRVSGTKYNNLYFYDINFVDNKLKEFVKQTCSICNIDESEAEVNLLFNKCEFSNNFFRLSTATSSVAASNPFAFQRHYKGIKSLDVLNCLFLNNIITGAHNLFTASNSFTKYSLRASIFILDSSNLTILTQTSAELTTIEECIFINDKYNSLESLINVAGYEAPNTKFYQTIEEVPDDAWPKDLNIMLPKPPPTIDGAGTPGWGNGNVQIPSKPPTGGEVTPEPDGEIEIIPGLDESHLPKDPVLSENPNYEAIAGGTNYETLQEAIDAVEPNGTVELLSGIILRDSIIIPNKNLTIDLKGYNINGGKEDAIVIQYPCEVKITDSTDRNFKGTIEGSDCAVLVDNEETKLTIDSIRLEDNKCGIYMNGGEVSINETRIQNSTEFAVYGQDAKITIYNSNICYGNEAPVGIRTDNCELKIMNSNVIESGTDTELSCSNSQVSISDCYIGFKEYSSERKIFKMSNCVGAMKTGTLVYPGTPSTSNYLDGDFIIKKGVLIKTPLLEEVDTTEFPFLLSRGEDEKEYYKTIAEAMQNVYNDDKLTIYQDITLTEPVDIDKNLVIDLNGHTISGNGTFTLFKVCSAKLTIDDSSEGKTGKLTDGGGSLIPQSIAEEPSEIVELSEGEGEKADTYELARTEESHADIDVNTIGGAIQVYQNGQVNIENCTFENNTAELGSDIGIYEGRCIIKNGTFNGNIYGYSSLVKIENGTFKGDITNRSCYMHIENGAFDNISIATTNDGATIIDTGAFDNCTFTATGNAGIVVKNGKYIDTTFSKEGDTTDIAVLNATLISDSKTVDEFFVGITTDGLSVITDKSTEVPQYEEKTYTETAVWVNDKEEEFATFNEAINSTNNDSRHRKVKLLKNLEQAATNVLRKPAIVDLNGKSLTATNECHCFNVDGTAAFVLLNGSINNFYGYGKTNKNDSSTYERYGSAIYAKSVNKLVIDSILFNGNIIKASNSNSASTGGSCIGVLYPGNVIINKCSFINNKTTGYSSDTSNYYNIRGGIITTYNTYVEKYTKNSKFIVSNCIFKNNNINSSYNGLSGGILYSICQKIKMINCTVEDNKFKVNSNSGAVYGACLHSRGGYELDNICFRNNNVYTYNTAYGGFVSYEPTDLSNNNVLLPGKNGKINNVLSRVKVIDNDFTGDTYYGAFVRVYYSTNLNYKINLQIDKKTVFSNNNFDNSYANNVHLIFVEYGQKVETTFNGTILSTSQTLSSIFRYQNCGNNNADSCVTEINGKIDCGTTTPWIVYINDYGNYTLNCQCASGSDSKIYTSSNNPKVTYGKNYSTSAGSTKLINYFKSNDGTKANKIVDLRKDCRLIKNIFTKKTLDFYSTTLPEMTLDMNGFSILGNNTRTLIRLCMGGNFTITNSSDKVSKLTGGRGSSANSTNNSSHNKLNSNLTDCAGGVFAVTRSSGDTLTIDNISVEGNSAKNGGIFTPQYGGLAYLVFTNCTIKDNYADSRGDICISFADTSNDMGRVTFDNCKIYNNGKNNLYLADLTMNYFTGGNGVTIKNSSVYNNKSGIFTSKLSNDSALPYRLHQAIIQNSKIYENKTSDTFRMNNAYIVVKDKSSIKNTQFNVSNESGNATFIFANSDIESENGAPVILTNDNCYCSSSIVNCNIKAPITAPRDLFASNASIDYTCKFNGEPIGGSSSGGDSTISSSEILVNVDNQWKVGTMFVNTEDGWQENFIATGKKVAD